MLLTPFYQELRSRWNTFARRHGLPASLVSIPDASGRTWLDVFNDSVFYPRRPAIPGPIFFDLIAEQDRLLAVHLFGPGCVIDFYCFLQQVHESIHKVQVGEPLLNELVQAAIWVAFLNDSPELWTMQRNSVSGACAVRELDTVRQHPQLVQAALATNLDTATLVDRSCREGTYFRCCLLANAFDANRFRYADYLARVSVLLHEDQEHDRHLSPAPSFL